MLNLHDCGEKKDITMIITLVKSRQTHFLSFSGISKRWRRCQQCWKVRVHLVSLKKIIFYTGALSE